jgi:hypothetical protein
MPKVFIKPKPERAKFGGIWAISRHFPMDGEELEVSDEQFAVLSGNPGLTVTVVEVPVVEEAVERPRTRKKKDSE